MLSPESPQHTLTARSTWLGFQQLLPISLFVAAFGTAFGLAATQMGLSNNNILLMSAFVFAGASQFAVLELWGAQVSIIPVLVTVFAINARHLLMGATLYPWLKNLPRANVTALCCWFQMLTGPLPYKPLIRDEQVLAYY